jgi:hypothetical protein
MFFVGEGAETPAEGFCDIADTTTKTSMEKMRVDFIDSSFPRVLFRSVMVHKWY